MSQSHPLYTGSIAVQQVTAAGLCVGYDGKLPSAGGAVFGCLVQACTTAGQVLPAARLGTCVATAAAAIAAGALVAVDATGKVVTQADTAIGIGRALEAATASGDRIEVWLLTH